ncbi:MAG: phosphate ABC transporter substrate-binding protein, partial [Aestuariibacter sp.]|nr:phosphate ABC transporter substrate-binding protein [Aestuariibacter sp.]MCP4236093.1 phosphate ABC transporter substrate-binding protein [Aestuariibacter sp.]
YLTAFSSDNAWGDEGYLADKGMIPMPTEERARFAADIGALKNLEM